MNGQVYTYYSVMNQNILFIIEAMEKHYNIIIIRRKANEEFHDYCTVKVWRRWNHGYVWGLKVMGFSQ